MYKYVYTGIFLKSSSTVYSSSVYSKNRFSSGHKLLRKFYSWTQSDTKTNSILSLEAVTMVTDQSHDAVCRQGLRMCVWGGYKPTNKTY